MQAALRRPEPCERCLKHLRLCIPGHHGAIKIGFIIIFDPGRYIPEEGKKLMKKTNFPHFM